MAFNNSLPETSDTCQDDDELILIREILEKGMDISESDNLKLRIALHNSCNDGREDIVELLLTHKKLDSGSSFSWSSHCDIVQTALVNACQNGYDKIVDLLIKHYHSTGKNDAGPNGWGACAKSALMVACMQNFNKIVDVLLLNYKDCLDVADKGMDDVVIYLCDNGYETVLESLIDFGFRVDDVRESNGTTALVYLCMNGCKKIVNMLLQNGADVNRRSAFQQTALMAACSNGEFEIAEILLGYGAEVDARYAGGSTSLLESAKYGYEKVVNLLLLHGSEMETKDNKGKTALMYACKKGYISIVENLIQRGVNINARSELGVTAIMITAAGDYVQCFEALLRAGANLDAIDTQGGTVFTYTLEGDGTTVTLLLEDGKIFHNEELKLKSVHYDAIASARYISEEGLVATIKFGVFEWDWCPRQYYYEDAYLAALNSSYCPGKIKCHPTAFSPLVLAFISNDVETVETFLSRLYYFPEDYQILSTDKTITSLIDNAKDTLDKFTHTPLSLLTWSFLTVSKRVSLSGAPRSRRKRVDLLPLPTIMKRRLNFEIVS